MEAKKKILILGKLPPPYMGPSVAFEILINSGLKNHYNLLSLDVKANETLDTLGKWSFNKLVANVKIYNKLLGLLKREQPDVVLIPISQATIGFLKDSVFILLCKLTGSRCLVQLRGSDFRRWVTHANPFTQWYVKWILKMTLGVLVLGNNLKYLFEDYYNAGQIHVVPNGGNYNIVPVDKIPGEKIKIIYLANLQPSKGIEDVIAAAAILEKEIPGTFTLQVIGAWRKESTRLNCLRLVEENKLPVTFLPPQVNQDKFQHLLSSDIFVFTPREPEGHPWVIIEAMAAGLPVISTGQGAIPESVLDGENGFIVAANRPGEIALKLKELILDHSLRKRMGQKSRSLYLEKFTEDQMVANYVRAFDSVLLSER